MLLNVHVKNLALIEDVDICFREGLNILTGETGAGKSIIIGSIGVALGAKAGKDLIRQGADTALVELVFSVSEQETIDKLRNMDIEPEDGQIIITRKLTNGKSIIKVNGETMTATALRQVASLLIDVHGQHDYETLVHTDKHMDILDAYAGAEVVELKSDVSNTYKDYKESLAQLEEFSKDEEQRIRDLSFYEYEANEISTAELQVGEDEALEEEYKKMTHSRKIIESIGVVYEGLCGADNSISSTLSYGLREMSSVSGLDKKLEDFYESLNTMDSICSDLSKELSRYMDELNFDEQRVAYVSERLDTINKLKLKHGRSIEDILKKLNDLNEKISNLNNYDEAKKQLEAKVTEQEKLLKTKSDKLSAARKKAAKELEKSIVQALMDLNFLEVKFEIAFTPLEKYTSKGQDAMEFMISTNPGEPLKPLAKIASGGELSRIMLGIKAILAKKDAVDTLIFDEIDTGISGKTAGMVADKMSSISGEHQVICITHLPQIAAYADAHFVIEKNVINGNTTTDIRLLDEDTSVGELARMLGGTVITDAALDNARELKKLAGKY